MLTSLRSRSSSRATSIAAPAANPRRGSSPFVRRLAGLALVLPLALLIVGCSTDVGDTAANVILNIDTITLESDPWGDVLATSGTILDDTVLVTFSAFLKGPVTTNAQITTPELQNINLERYEVTFTRTDGGTAVPPGFTRGIAGTVRLTVLGAEELKQFTLGVVLVPSTIKAQPPISFLISPGQEPATNFVNIQVDARIQFFGRTITGDPVRGMRRSKPFSASQGLGVIVQRNIVRILSFVDVDIRDVVRFFSQITGINLVLDPSVGSPVTMELFQVPVRSTSRRP